MSGPDPDKQVFSGSAQMAAADFWRKQNRANQPANRLSIAQYRRMSDNTGQPTMQERAEHAATHKRIILNISLLLTALALICALYIAIIAHANGGEKCCDFSPQEMSRMRGFK